MQIARHVQPQLQGHVCVQKAAQPIAGSFQQHHAGEAKEQNQGYQVKFVILSCSFVMQDQETTLLVELEFWEGSFPLVMDEGLGHVSSR